MLKSDINYQKEQLEKSIFSLKEIISNARNNINKPMVSDAAIIAIMQECPCIRRCSHDIMKESYNRNGTGQVNQKIDGLYTAKHDLAKNFILEAIQREFSSYNTKIRSEHDYGNGHLDIAIEDNRIIITHQGRRIGIEIKSGTYIDTKHLYQIIRLLFDVDILVFARIPMEHVDVIYQQDMIQEIVQNISSIVYKVNKIVNKDESLMQGDCCKGCTVDCEFARPSKFLGASKPNLSDFTQYMKQLEATKSKVVQELSSILESHQS
jgi:hypothetical protein